MLAPLVRSHSGTLALKAENRPPCDFAFTKPGECLTPPVLTPGHRVVWQGSAA